MVKTILSVVSSTRMSASRAPQSQHQAPIATGGYGCVYRPAVTCKGVPSAAQAQRLTGTVAKLQQVSRMSENEIRIGEIVAGLPASERYFVVADSSCTVSSLRFPKTVSAGCQPVVSDTDVNPTARLVVMRMRDVPHEKLGTTPPRPTPDQLRNMLRNLVIGIPHCLEALVLLQANNQPIVHFDLKTGNIFAPESPSALPLIADFGISFLPLEQTFAKAKLLTIAYEPGYYVWPPEVHLLCYLLHANRPNPEEPATAEELAGVAQRVAASNPMLTNDAARISARAAATEAFYRKLAPVTANRVYSYVMSHWDKIDLYALCMCFGTILQAYDLGGEGEYLAPVSKVLQEGVGVDPAERPRLGELLAVSRRAVSGSAQATITGLATVKDRAERNRGAARATLQGVERTLGRLTVRLDAALVQEG